MTDNKNLSSTSLSGYPADVVFLSLFFTGSFVGVYSFFNRYLRQYTKVSEIPSSVFRKRWLFGKVTSVGDGDNFHFFHAPGGLLGGWGWIRELPQLIKLDINELVRKKRNLMLKATSGHKSFLDQIFQRNRSRTAYSNYYLNLPVIYKNRRNLKTIPIRICGVDAPERAHFGNPSQPFSDEALNWLSYTLLGKMVWIKPLSVDQYNRCVAKVVYFTWTGWKNISLEMLKEGLAVVYESKKSAEFDGEERRYRKYEHKAKSLKKGIWSQKKIETPGEYKKRL